MKLDPVAKAVLVGCWVAVCVLASLDSAQAKKKKEPPTKSVHGHVVDGRKKSIVGAKVYIRNVDKKTTTVLITDENGLYAIYGLDPKVDYDVHAEHGKFVSEKKRISSFLNRFDNVFNFELGASDSSTANATAKAVSAEAVELSTADHFKLTGEWYSPGDVDDKLPAVLLVHGFGQDRSQWEAFVRQRLLPSGYAALTLDLRGHGASREKAGAEVNAEPSWRFDARQFPLDVEAAIRWLKSRKDVDVNRIAVVGCDLGADLAFVASGKYEEVRSAVAISGDAKNAALLAKEIPNFQPHSILYVATQGDSLAATSARDLEKRTGFPVKVQIYENSGARGAKILEEIPEAAELTVDWLKKM